MRRYVKRGGHTMAMNVPVTSAGYGIKSGGKGGKEQLILALRKKGESKESAMERVSSRHPAAKFTAFPDGYVLDAEPNFGEPEGYPDELVFDIEDRGPGLVALKINQEDTTLDQFMARLAEDTPEA